jgi:transmembrane sensor
MDGGVVSKRSSRIAAEACAWLARLQGGTRSPSGDAAFKDWLRADPAHEEAFETATDIWLIIPGAAQSIQELTSHRTAHPRLGDRWRTAVPQMAFAASVMLVLGISLALWLTRPTTYSTGVGEQKVATLEDGTQIALNTDSSLEVRYDSKERRIALDRGEAMFEVAHNNERPFIVRAGGTQVRAVGTSFIVRRDGNGITVTLIEGKVAVTNFRSAARDRTPIYLSAGHRLRASAKSEPRIDLQSPSAATAWRRGQVVFSNTPLGDAVTELNRYGGPQLVIDDPSIATLPLSGVFATNDTAEFAHAIAALRGLRVKDVDGTLHIVS